MKKITTWFEQHEMYPVIELDCKPDSIHYSQEIELTEELYYKFKKAKERFEKYNDKILAEIERQCED